MLLPPSHSIILHKFRFTHAPRPPSPQPTRSSSSAVVLEQPRARVLLLEQPRPRLLFLDHHLLCLSISLQEQNRGTASRRNAASSPAASLQPPRPLPATPRRRPAAPRQATAPSSRSHRPAKGFGERRKEMSYLLPHLHSGWAVDQAILAEEERLVVIRFGHDWDETCMQMDEVLASVAETIKNFAVIYLVDITEVPDFNTMYELYDPSTVMFFFRNKHIMIDLGTGNNNKINWALKDKQEFIDIIETVYRGARKGRGLVIAPKDYSTKYRY
ncbi:hypothetical protein PIB30_082079 [Stylosanthes scabra]|uniref:Thioredoxin-like protein YLS8 n=1 Tax=Stylosanthes scabra TaxID=79078 RepID=A0ABU6WRS6_9FABA|nr:hypothetical protein [Stylosanthes scabra]